MDSAKLLIVDDDLDSRTTKARLLQQAGLDTDATDPNGAPSRFEAFGLVILDATDGATPDFCKTIKAQNPTTSILCIARTQQDVAPMIRAAADGFLIDPAQPSEFLALVDALLRLHKTKVQLRGIESRLQLVEKSGNLAFADCDLVAGTTFRSEKFAQLFQLPTATAKARLELDEILNVVHEEDKAELLTEYKRLLRRGGDFDRDFRIRGAGGATVWINARGSFVEGAGGRVERIFCLCSDITERKQAESRNAQLAAIVASAIDAIVTMDRDDVITTWNRAAEQLFGYPAEDAVGRKGEFFVPPALVQERAAMMQRLLNGDSIEYQTQRVHKNGHSLDVWVRAAPMRRADGTIFGSSFTVRNVSAQKQREEHVRFLIRELAHRSKNLLAVIQAMARQSLSLHKTPEEFVVRFTERLSGLAGSHDLLLSDDWAGASLIQLIRSQLQQYDSLFDSRIRLEGTDLILRPEAAQNIGIALHELSTNAAKFGALSVDDGTVTVSWEIVTDESNRARMQLRWKEQSGPPVTLPSHKGFGRMVMDRIAGQALGGFSKVVFAPDGVSWELDVPASAVLREKMDPL